MKKKIAVILMALAISMSACACNKSEEETKKTKKTTETEEVEQIEKEDLALDCFWSYTEDDGSGYSFRFFEDGTGIYNSYAGGGMDGSYLGSFTYKLKKDNQLTISSEDTPDIEGKYTISFNNNGQLVMRNEKGKTIYKLDQKDIKDFDMSELYDCQWVYRDDEGNNEVYKFNEDQTGTYAAWHDGSEHFYKTDFTWTIQSDTITNSDDSHVPTGLLLLSFKKYTS